ncbi:MAG: hypothetical protein NZ988_01105 [Thaumarchaeota archaeon]|nr:hypothetical protein [Candidatus Calditenuaceae archaeon]MDW8186631.1 hypothetical protein [Nitrososphaerota archaeon]
MRAVAERETIEWVRIAGRGMTLITDPMLLWHDLFRPFAENVKGLSVNGLSRWYDNNMFYKVPLIKGRLELEGPFLDRYLFPSVLSGSRVKLILPDPLTMQRLSLNDAYSDVSELVMDLAEVISVEASRLISKWGLKVELVQLTAPEMARGMSEDELSLVREVVRLFKRRLGCPLQLHTFFFSAAKALRSLLDTGADVLGIDLHATPVSALRGLSVDRELALGIIDSRSVIVEDPVEHASLVGKVLDATGAKRVHLTTNTDLDYLPMEVAKEKVSSLLKCAEHLKGVLA